MELRTLRLFVEVVRLGSFSEAAKTLFTTQSNVSKAVKLLEEELGCVLLDRANHRNSLTEAGSIVYQHALSMLAERASLNDALDELRGMKRGLLRLGVPTVGSDILFAPMFAAYRKKYPNIDIRLVEHGSKRLAEMLLSGEIDLAGALLPVDETHFEWKEIRREPIDVVISVNHPLAKKKTLQLEEFANVPMILFEASFALNQLIVDACSKSGFTPTVAARSSQIDFIIELVAVNLGVSFLPRMIAQQRSHTGVKRIAISAPLLEWHLALIWRRDAYLSQAAKAWIELIR